MEWSCACGNIKLFSDSSVVTHQISDSQIVQQLLLTSRGCLRRGLPTGAWSVRTKHDWLTVTIPVILSTDQFSSETDQILSGLTGCQCEVKCCAICEVRLCAEFPVGQGQKIQIINEAQQSRIAQGYKSPLLGIVLPEEVTAQQNASSLITLEFNMVRARARIEEIASQFIAKKTEEYRAALASDVSVAERDKDLLLKHISRLFGEAQSKAEPSGANAALVDTANEATDAAFTEPAKGSASGFVLIDQLGSELENAVLAEMDIASASEQQEQSTVSANERESSSALGALSSDQDDALVFSAARSRTYGDDDDDLNELEESSVRPARLRAEAAVYSTSVPISIPMRTEAEVTRQRAAVPAVPTVAETEDETEQAVPASMQSAAAVAAPRAALDADETPRFGASLRALRSQTLTESTQKEVESEREAALPEEDDRTSLIGRKMAESVRQADAFALFERPQRARPRAFTNDAMSARPAPLAASKVNQPRIVTFDSDRP